jgi:sec-independent protein translocase protein TatB
MLTTLDGLCCCGNCMALVVFGPRRLPQIGRQIGKLMYEFRKASNDFKFQMEEELRTSEDADRRKKEEDRLRALTLAAPPQVGLTESSSQVSEASHEAPVLVDGGSQVSEPGPFDELRAGSGATESAENTEESYPRIMPPSSGEQVAAARPHSLTALAQAANESGAAVAVEPELAANAEAPAVVTVEERAADETVADPEQAAHHG